MGKFIKMLVVGSRWWKLVNFAVCLKMFLIKNWEKHTKKILIQGKRFKTQEEHTPVCEGPFSIPVPKLIDTVSKGNSPGAQDTRVYVVNKTAAVR